MVHDGEAGGHPGKHQQGQKNEGRRREFTDPGNGRNNEGRSHGSGQHVRLDQSYQASRGRLASMFGILSGPRIRARNPKVGLVRPPNSSQPDLASKLSGWPVHSDSC
jgi:hypothetical protein